jgi:hypothetical protein
VETPEKIVFILSTGRTGTKTLAEGLAGDGIKSPHQPPFSRLLTIASSYYLHGWLPKNTLEWLVTHLREPQILKADCRYYIQVFSLDYLPAKIISKKYPNVYIIHIVRDPRTFVRSYLNWMHSRFKSWMANKVVPGWHPSGYFTGELSWREWRWMGEFQRVCWQWAYKNTLLERLFADDERYIRIRFEDLFLTANSGTLKEMLAFVGIVYRKQFEAMLEKSKNVSRKAHFPAWETWEPGRCAHLNELCSPMMKRFGYGQESLWQEKVEIGQRSPRSSGTRGESV